MRGPGIRLKYDVRRLWRCPQCGYERHAPATEVAVHCHCDRSEPFMRLVESKRSTRSIPVHSSPYVDWEELLEEEPAESLAAEEAQSQDGKAASRQSEEESEVAEPDSVVADDPEDDPDPESGGDDAQL